jgi:hypothetical protein
MASTDHVQGIMAPTDYVWYLHGFHVIDVNQ